MTDGFCSLLVEDRLHRRRPSRHHAQERVGQQQRPRLDLEPQFLGHLAGDRELGRLAHLAPHARW